MSVSVTIERASVMSEVRKTTAYIGSRNGSKLDGVDEYERIASLPEDEEMLLRFWDEALTAVVSSKKRYLQSLTRGDSAASFTFRSSVSDGTHVSKALFSYIVNHIVMMWLLVCGLTSYAEVYRKTLQKCLSDLNASLSLSSTSDADTVSSSERSDNTFGASLDSATSDDDSSTDEAVDGEQRMQGNVYGLGVPLWYGSWSVTYYG